MAMEGDSVEAWDEFEEELEIILQATNDELIYDYVRPAIQRQMSLYHL